MTTKKLFEQDGLLTHCSAVVLSCEKAKDGWDIALDQTVIFPESGGQPSDKGRINQMDVTASRLQDALVYHRCPAPIPVGATVMVAIDWPARLDHSQQHTGEHMLSHALWVLFGARNVGFHMNEAVGIIDFDREFTPAEWTRAEDHVNAQIWADRPVHIYHRAEDDISDLAIRKVTDKANGWLRIIEVEGGDICACCGTHVRSTGQVGVLKIIRAERHRGGARIEFLCGGRALADYRQKHQIVSAAGAELSTRPEQILQRIQALKMERRDMGMQLRSRVSLLMDFIAKEARTQAVHKNGGTCICVATEVGAGEAKQLLKKLLQDPSALVALFYLLPDKVGYIIAKTNPEGPSCREICQIANGLFCGKGGGSNLLAQGAGKYTGDWRELVEMVKGAILNLLS